MRNEDRKAAISAYKERKDQAGIYAVRCVSTGATWVGKAPNLDTIQNRIFFTLRRGGHPRHDLQAAWREHGADAFSFEVLESIEAESAYARTATLKERLAHWLAALGAQPI